MKLENFVCPWCRAMTGPAAASPKKSFRNQESFKDELSTEELREILEEKGLDSSGRRATLFSRLQTYEKEQIRKEKSSPTTTATTTTTTTSSSKNEDLDIQKQILNEIRQEKNNEEEEESKMDVDDEEEEDDGRMEYNFSCLNRLSDLYMHY